MDIKAIIKGGLPEDVTLTDAQLTAIAKEIKAQQGLEFIPKEQYSKKIERIDELEAEIKTLQGTAADAGAYKNKIDALTTQLANLKTQAETEKASAVKAVQDAYDSFKTETQSKEKDNTARQILRSRLEEDGANPKVIKLLLKEFDLTKVKFDGEGDAVKIKNLDEIYKPVKEQNADLFSVTTVTGTDPATPPKGGGTKTPNNKDMNAFIRGIIE